MLKRTLIALLVAVPLHAADLRKPMADVERLRDLTFLHDVTQRDIERKDLRQVLRREIAKSLPYPAEDYVRVLQALQLVDNRQPALMDKMLDLYESQVLAFYDPLSHTYFAIRQLPAALEGVAGAEALRQSVVVHELTHAMQDQRFEASKRDLALQHDADGQLAYHALLEGEASLVMVSWLLEKSGQSLDAAVKNDMMLGLMSSAAAAEKSIDPSTPAYFVESLKFPYLEGLKLVVAAYKRGGWAAVNRLHENPPQSTREILHLSEYFARLDRGEKRTPIPDLRPATADILSTEHLGEFHWRFLVGDAATGWINDRVTILCDGTVHVQTWWENPDRAAAFRNAYVSFLRDRGIEPGVKTQESFVDVLYLCGASPPAGLASQRTGPTQP